MSKTSDENIYETTNWFAVVAGAALVAAGFIMLWVLITCTGDWFEKYSTTIASLLFAFFALVACAGFVVGVGYFKGARQGYDLTPQKELSPGETARLDSNLRATRRRPRG